jgi:hypothetical protein
MGDGRTAAAESALDHRYERDGSPGGLPRRAKQRVAGRPSVTVADLCDALWCLAAQCGSVASEVDISLHSSTSHSLPPIEWRHSEENGADETVL